jgi:hypothetical protein
MTLYCDPVDFQSVDVLKQITVFLYACPVMETSCVLELHRVFLPEGGDRAGLGNVVNFRILIL